LVVKKGRMRLDVVAHADAVSVTRITTYSTSGSSAVRSLWRGRRSFVVVTELAAGGHGVARVHDQVDQHLIEPFAADRHLHLGRRRRMRTWTSRPTCGRGWAGSRRSPRWRRRTDRRSGWRANDSSWPVSSVARSVAIRISRANSRTVCDGSVANGAVARDHHQHVVEVVGDRTGRRPTAVF
jgi:hypothetical protein